MGIKKITLGLLLGFSVIGSACAGVADWDGTFDIQSNNGKSLTITHTNDRAVIGFLTLAGGSCLSVTESFFGTKVSQPMTICSDLNPDAFTREVQKLGTITSKSIKLGPTYSKK